MIWKPNKMLGALVGVFIALTVTGIVVFLLNASLNQPFGPSLFLTSLLLMLSLPTWGLVMYWLLGMLTLSYQLDRSRLIIRCIHSQHTVPLASITRVVKGSQVAIEEGFAGISWPGYMMGRYQLKDGSSLFTHSTEPIDRQLVIMTSRGNYGISPNDIDGFLSEVDFMLSEGSTRIVQGSFSHAPIFELPVWRDKWYWGIVILCLAVNLALWGTISFLYAGLPDRLPLQFDPRGRIELVGSKAGLLIVPIIGSMTWIANSILGLLIHYRERFAVSMLIGVNLLVQILSWVAVLRIIG